MCRKKKNQDELAPKELYSVVSKTVIEDDDGFRARSVNTNGWCERRKSLMHCNIITGLEFRYDVMLPFYRLFPQR